MQYHKLTHSPPKGWATRRRQCAAADSSGDLRGAHFGWEGQCHRIRLLQPVLFRMALAFVFITSVCSCDPVRRIRIDDGFEKRIEFPCGTVTIAVMKRMCPGYAIVNRFEMSEPTSADLTAVRATIGDRVLPLGVYRNGVTAAPGVIPLDSQDELSLLIDADISENDSITVTFNDYLRCGSATLNAAETAVVIKAEK